MIRQTVGFRLILSLRNNQRSAQPNGCQSMLVARRHIEISGSIIAQPLRHITLRRPELHPELLLRRRAIVAAIRSRSSCWILLKQGNLRSQSLAQHNVTGFCLMLFPRFRKTLAILLNAASRPYFASEHKIPLASPIPGKTEGKRLTTSNAAIPGR